MVSDNRPVGPSDDDGSESEFEQLKKSGIEHGFGVEEHITMEGRQQIAVFMPNGYGVSMIDYLKSKNSHVSMVIVTGTCLDDMVICSPESWPIPVPVEALDVMLFGIKYENLCFKVSKPVGIKFLCSLAITFPNCKGASDFDTILTDEVIKSCVKDDGDIPSDFIPSDLKIDPSTKTAEELRAILDKYVPGITSKIDEALAEMRSSAKAKPKSVSHPYNQRFSSN